MHYSQCVRPWSVSENAITQKLLEYFDRLILITSTHWACKKCFFLFSEAKPYIVFIL